MAGILCAGDIWEWAGGAGCLDGVTALTTGEASWRGVDDGLLLPAVVPTADDASCDADDDVNGGCTHDQTQSISNNILILTNVFLLASSDVMLVLTAGKGSRPIRMRLALLASFSQAMASILSAAADVKWGGVGRTCSRDNNTHLNLQCYLLYVQGIII